MKSTQKTIGLDSYLWNSLDSWLLTEPAKNRGFHSKAQFANFAVGDYLTQFKDHVYTTSEMLRQLNDSYINLSSRFDKQLDFVDKLERFWFKNNYPNLEI